MNRLTTRLYAMAALLNGGAVPPPTVAGAFVYDSRIEDIDVSTDELRQPTITVRTESDESTELTEGGEVGSRILELKIEFGVLTAAKVEGAGGPEYIPQWPDTDAGLEGMLDFMEWQIMCALMGPSIWARRFMRTPPGAVTSAPLVIDNEFGRSRLAARELTFRLDQFPSDNFPPMLREDDPPYVPVLPDELVECFAIIFNDGAGDFRDYVMDLQASLLAQQLPAAGIYPPLLSVYASEIPSDAPAPPTSTDQEVPYVEAEFLEQGGP